MQNSQELLQFIAQKVYDKKGINLLGLDLREIHDFVDCCLICEGLVDRHVKALYDTILEECKVLGISPLYVDGNTFYDWVVLDFGAVVVHIMLPSMREKYNLEELYRKADLITLDLSTQT